MSIQLLAWMRISGKAFPSQLAGMGYTTENGARQRQDTLDVAVGDHDAGKALGEGNNRQDAITAHITDGDQGIEMAVLGNVKRPAGDIQPSMMVSLDKDPFGDGPGTIGISRLPS
jgi:hypothetical protein